MQNLHSAGSTASLIGRQSCAVAGGCCTTKKAVVPAPFFGTSPALARKRNIAGRNRSRKSVLSQALNLVYPVTWKRNGMLSFDWRYTALKQPAVDWAWRKANIGEKERFV